MAEGQGLTSEDGTTGKYPFPTYAVTNLVEAAKVLNQDDLKVKADTDNEESGRVALYGIYRDWYKGEHAAVLTDRQQELFEQLAGGDMSVPFSDNFTDVVVDSVTRRLKLEGFTTTPEPADGDDTFVDATKEIMRKNRMDIRSTRVHHNAIKLGDAFVILDFDTERNIPTITYNRPDIIRAEYDDDTGEEMLWVSKVWETDEISPFNPEKGVTIARMNVYYPDRIEKYWKEAEGEGDWEPFMDIDVDPAKSDQLWPVPWIDESTGDHLGIPVFHFRNKTYDDGYGISEIAKTIPQQRMLNKWLLDLDLVMDTQGFPQRWIAGAEGTASNIDEDGNARDAQGVDADPGGVWTHPDKETKFGQFPAAPVEGPLAAIDMLIRHISFTNSTPIDDLTGGKQASGEALKMKDSGLSDKADEKESLFGNVWEDIIRYCHTLRNVYAQGVTRVELGEEVTIESVWADTSPRNDKQVVEVLSGVVALGASNKWALERYGVQDVDDVMAEAEAEKDAATDRGIRAITRGTDTLDADLETATDIEGVNPNE